MLLRLKKPMAAVMAAVMLFAMAGCKGKEDGGEVRKAGGYSFNWLDSNLLENVDKMGEAKITDDFAAAVNYEWTKAQKEDNSYSMSSFGEAMRKVVENKRAILNDK